MKTMQAVIVTILLAGTMVGQAIGRDMAGNSARGEVSAQPAVYLPASSPSPDIVYAYGGRPFYRPGPWCEDVVSLECWRGRCQEVVRTVCREDRWRHRPWYGDHGHWRDRRWDGDRWDHDRWRDRDRDRWRDHDRDRWHDRRDRW